MDAVNRFAEAAWTIVVFPESYDNTVAEMANWLESCPFSDVKCPTHISHGTKDEDPISHAKQAHEGIEGSVLKLLEGGWHLLDVHPEWPALWNEQVEFANKYK